MAAARRPSRQQSWGRSSVGGRESITTQRCRKTAHFSGDGASRQSRRLTAPRPGVVVAVGGRESVARTFPAVRRSDMPKRCYPGGRVPIDIRSLARRRVGDKWVTGLVVRQLSIDRVRAFRVLRPECAGATVLRPSDRLGEFNPSTKQTAKDAGGSHMGAPSRFEASSPEQGQTTSGVGSRSSSRSRAGLMTPDRPNDAQYDSLARSTGRTVKKCRWRPERCERYRADVTFSSRPEFVVTEGESGRRFVGLTAPRRGRTVRSGDWGALATASQTSATIVRRLRYPLVLKCGKSIAPPPNVRRYGRQQFNNGRHQ